MDIQEELIKKLYQTLNLMMCESKIARTYGTCHELTSSEIDLLKCVQRNCDAKLSELSGYLGVTSGAVTQLAGKLEKKGYIEPYRATGNRKEKYYKLTKQGETACTGFDAHYAEMMLGVGKYVADLDKASIEKITGLLDVVAESLIVKEQCSIKHDIDKSCCSDKADGKRCEKCQRVY